MKVCMAHLLLADQPEPPVEGGTGERRSLRNQGKEISYKESRTNAKMRQS